MKEWLQLNGYIGLMGNNTIMHGVTFMANYEKLTEIGSLCMKAYEQQVCSTTEVVRVGNAFVHEGTSINMVISFAKPSKFLFITCFVIELLSE